MEDLRLQPFFNRRFELSVEQDFLLLGLRVIIPTRYQEDMSEELHTGQPDIVRMKETARTYFWWTNIDQENKKGVRSCGSCHQVRKPPAVALVTPSLWPCNPWYRVHIDYAEDENGHYFILVDIHYRWPKMYFMQQNTTATTTIAISRKLFAKYGLPVHCVVENSPQFRSEEFAHFMKVNGVKGRCKYQISNILAACKYSS